MPEKRVQCLDLGKSCSRFEKSLEICLLLGISEALEMINLLSADPAVRASDWPWTLLAGMRSGGPAPNVMFSDQT